MKKTIPRLIAVYSATCISAETAQKEPLFSCTEGNAFAPTRSHFLAQLCDAKRAYPLGFYIAYLRFIGTNPRYFAALIQALQQHLYLPQHFTWQDQHAVVLAALYFAIIGSASVSVIEAIYCYGALANLTKQNRAKMEALLVNSVLQQQVWLEQQFQAFEKCLEEELNE